MRLPFLCPTTVKIMRESPTLFERFYATIPIDAYIKIQADEIAAEQAKHMLKKHA